MVDIVYNIFEDDFVRSQTHQYNLSVLLGADRLSYLITNAENKVLGLRSYKFAGLLHPIEHLLKEDVIFNSSYGTTKVGVFSKQFTLVPTALYEADTQKSYLETLVQLPEQAAVLVDDWSAVAAKYIYATSSNLISEIQTAFPQATIFHQSTGLVTNFSTNFDKTTSNIFLSVQDHTVNITVLDKGELIFHNIFAFKASADCLYFVLLVYQQLGLQPTKNPLYVVGELVEDSEIHQLLYKYIKTIKFVGFPNFYTFGNNIKQELPPNFFFDLYSLKLCE